MVTFCEREMFVRMGKERRDRTLIDFVFQHVSISMNQISFEQMFEEKKQVLKLFY